MKPIEECTWTWTVRLSNCRPLSTSTQLPRICYRAQRSFLLVCSPLLDWQWWRFYCKSVAELITVIVKKNKDHHICWSKRNNLNFHMLMFMNLYLSNYEYLLDRIYNIRLNSSRYFTIAKIISGTLNLIINIECKYLLEEISTSVT